jgi:hypothetical protein
VIKHHGDDGQTAQAIEGGQMATRALGIARAR